jgi:hypothetical protein
MMRVALAIGLMVLANGAEAASNAPPPPVPTPVSVGAAPRWVPVCGRARPIGSGAFDATDTAIFDVTACFTPAAGGVRALKLSYMGDDISNDGIVDRAVTFTGTAAISLPAAQSSIVVNAAVASGATTIPVQIAMASPGNAVSVGEGIAGTGIPSGSWVASIIPTYVGGNLTSYAFTFTNLAGAATTTAALTAGQVLTATGRNHGATFGMQRIATIPPSDHFIDSDPIGIALPPASEFFVRGSFTASAPGFLLGDYPSPAGGTTRLAGEGSQRASSALPDHTLDQAVPSNSGGGYFAPWTVLGQVAVPTASILIVGDSIAAGTGDAADAYGRLGYIQRSLGNTVPWASIARGSTTAVQMVARPQFLQQAAAEIGATDVLLEYNRNDLNASGNPLTAAATVTNLQALAQPLEAAGIRVWAFTCPPTTASQDAWSSNAGQFLTQQQTATTAALAAGQASVTLSSASGIQNGELVAAASGTAVFAPGTTVTVTANTVTFSTPPTASLTSGTILVFGTRAVSATATPIEYQRELYNSTMRTTWRSQGYAGLIDMAAAVEDPNTTGLWRTDLGAASADGIHPSAALHSQLVGSGTITAGMFPVR